MIVKDLLPLIDYDVQAECMIHYLELKEQNVDREKFKKRWSDFVNSLYLLTPEQADHIFLFERIIDSCEEYTVFPCAYKTYDLYKFSIEHGTDVCPVNLNDFNSESSITHLNSLMKKFPTFPESYGFVDVPWNIVLGWSVLPEDIAEFGVQQCVFSILFEMTFFGMTIEDWEKNVNETYESLKEATSSFGEREVPTKNDDPDLEQLLHIRSFTDYEENENIRKTVFSCLKNSIWRFENLKKKCGVFFHHC